jgi:hypothetical protein
MDHYDELLPHSQFSVITGNQGWSKEFAQMIGSSLPKLFVSFMFLVSSGPPTISITPRFTKPATEKPSATVVSISVKNISSEPQSVTKSDAFSDFSIRLTDATNGLEVQLTKEAKELRSGTKHGFQIRSVHEYLLVADEIGLSFSCFDVSSGLAEESQVKWLIPHHHDLRVGLKNGVGR